MFLKLYAHGNSTADVGIKSQSAGLVHRIACDCQVPGRTQLEEWTGLLLDPITWCVLKGLHLPEEARKEKPDFNSITFISDALAS